MSGGSQGQQTQSTTSSSSSGPPQQIAPYLGALSNVTYDWFANHQNAPAYYPNGTVVPFSDRTQSGLTNLYNVGANGGALTNPASGVVGNTLNGQYLDISSNPYFQGALAAGFKPQTENFVNNVLPAISSQFEGAGRYGSGAHQGIVDQATTSLNRAQADAASMAALQAYNQERGYQAGAVSQVPTVLGAQTGAAQNMLTAGQLADVKAQQQRDADVAKYNYEQTAQPNWYGYIAQLLQGEYPGGQTTGQSTGWMAGQPASNPFGQALGGALALGGLGLNAYNVFSDARLKDIKARVGFTDSGLPLYLYNYKGESEPRVGPIAQEVEKLHPEAVKTHPSGYKMVDYSRGLF